MDTPRWNVETRPDTFDDVGAASCMIEAGGVLAFYGNAPERRLLIAYAAKAWLTVSTDDN